MLHYPRLTTQRNKRAVEALERMGVSEVVVVSGGDDLESGGSSEVAIGEAVDSHNADMVVIPWEQLHHHSIDANLLSEFVACPVLLLP